MKKNPAGAEQRRGDEVCHAKSRRAISQLASQERRHKPFSNFNPANLRFCTISTPEIEHSLNQSAR
jgi:hypothetical protein